MRAGDVGQVDLPHHAHAERRGALAGALEVLDVEDHHVAAARADAGEVAPGGGVGARRGNHLEEAVAHGEDRVGQAELAHAGVAERLAQAEAGSQRVGGRLELVGHEHRLAQSDPVRRSHRRQTSDRRLAAAVEAHAADLGQLALHPAGPSGLYEQDL